MAYARQLTKKELQEAGITEITKDCRVFSEQREIFPRWIKSGKDSMYLAIYIYDLDDGGNKINIPMTRQFKYKHSDGTEHVSKPVDTYVYKLRSIGLHRAMWAWHYGEVPEGLVVDHIDNQHDKLEDYRLENLQLLTPKENVTKERVCNVKEIKCKLNKPRSFYEDKLNSYTEQYEQAKLAKDSELCHRLRSNIAQCRARLRYWDSHSEEYLKAQEAKAAIAEAKEAKVAEAAVVAEAKAKRKADTEIKKKLKAIATEYRLRGNKAQWHQFNGLLKNFDAIPREKLEEITTKTMTKLGI